MCFRRYAILLFSWTFLATFSATALGADVNSIEIGVVAEQKKLVQVATQLVLTPSKCVALRKGRKCFATIDVKWQANDSGRYCLRRSIDHMVINCWRGQAHGEFMYVFRSENKEQLELFDEVTKRVVSTAVINVSWVYKSKRKKARWRVF